MAAIDQAVADGVDVINFSISGPSTSTVAHPGPWLTTVAAGTHNRNGEGTATLGNSVTYAGASVATPVSAPLIDAAAAGLPLADPTQVALCYGSQTVTRRITNVSGGPVTVSPSSMTLNHGVSGNFSVTFTNSTATPGGTSAGNMTVTAPTSATVGQTGAITLTTHGLVAGTKYLGSVAYGGTTGMPTPTIVRVDP